MNSIRPIWIYLQILLHLPFLFLFDLCYEDGEFEGQVNMDILNKDLSVGYEITRLPTEQFKEFESEVLIPYSVEEIFWNNST